MSTTRRIGALRTILTLLLAGFSMAWSAPVAFADDKLLKQLGRQLRVALSKENRDQVLELLGELRGMGGAATELIVEAVIRMESAAVFAEGVKILAALDGDELAPYFEDALASRKAPPAVLGFLMTVAGERDDERSEGWLVAGLSHPQELVRRLAIGSLKTRRSKAAIPHFIDILEERGMDRDTISFDARRALVALTGRDFDAVEDWRKFWEIHAEELDPQNLEADDGRTGLALVTPKDSRTEFFGVELVSQRVVFVVDISGSMQMVDEGGAEEGSRESPWEVRQRIRRVKKQLIGAIHGLAPTAYFNITAFNDRIHPFHKSMVPATQGWKKKAMTFVDRLSADRGTHTGEALQAAFEDPGFDTLVLLSDGAPSRSRSEGAQVMIPRILDLVRDLNRIRKVRIYTFGFDGAGTWPPGSRYRHQQGAGPFDSTIWVQFLRDLAESHDGTYTSID